MFERFTDNARAVLVQAGELARTEKSPGLRRHHLLISLLDSSNQGSQSVAAVLVYAGVDTTGLREKLLASLRTSEKALAEGDSSVPFTREAKKSLELALREALSLGHNYIGREHLLLGILREADGPLAEVLGATKLTHSLARSIVAEQSPPSVRGRRRGGPRAFRLGRRTTDGLQAVLRRTFDRAGNRDATTGDLLVALLETPGTHFAAAFAGMQMPNAEAAAMHADKLINEDVRDGIEDAVKVDPSGSVTVNDPRIATELKRLVGDGPVTPERIEEILRRLQG